jgi:3-dehydroquinate dehydratase
METGKTKIGHYEELITYIIDEDIGMTASDEKGNIKMCMSKENPAFLDLVHEARKGHINPLNYTQTSKFSDKIATESCPFYEAEPDLINAIAKIEVK